MSLEVRPLGVRCNLACTYCYQAPMREAGNLGPRYDLAAILQAITDADQPFTLFGGEALLVPKPDLETLFRYGFERFGKNTIQTNGVLIDDDHLELFERYRVHVGFSLDGPGELNDARWVRNRERTRQATARSMANLRAVIERGIRASVIVTLHQLNSGTDSRLGQLEEWIAALSQSGVASIRLHVLEADNHEVRETLSLPESRLAAVFVRLARFSRDHVPTLSVDVFDDIRNLLRGDDSSATCVWLGCDPWTTKAVQGIDGDGRASNCGRTNKEGIDWLKSDEEGFERYLALFQTPQENGGCAGCRFWLACRGNCPGTAIDGDPRNRSEHCSLWKELFELFETELTLSGELPISLSPSRPNLEAAFFRAWSNRLVPSLPRTRAAVGECEWHVPVLPEERREATLAV